MLCTEKLEDRALALLHEFISCSRAEIDKHFCVCVCTLLTKEHGKVKVNILLLESYILCFMLHYEKIIFLTVT